MNGKAIEDYIPFANLRAIVNQPFAVTKTEGQYDVLANVNGGGFSGQAGAVRHGIARALLAVDPDFRDALKKAGLLTRDPRMKDSVSVNISIIASRDISILLVSFLYLNGI